MDFGLFYYCQGRGVPHAQVCRSLELFAGAAIGPRQTVR